MNEDNRNSPFCSAAEEPPRKDESQGFKGKAPKTEREKKLELALSKCVLTLAKMADSFERISAFGGVNAEPHLRGVRELVADGVSLIMEGKDGGSESKEGGGAGASGQAS